jgi:excinuclease ABC subunit A
MVFLADVFVPCETCNGTRFKREVLDVKIKGHSIADVLQFTVEEALVRFKHQKKLGAALHHLQQVGLGYLRLGQPATTLSGGEAQRLKIARELIAAGKRKGRKLYILDEPTTGLHLDDVRVLIQVLDKLVDAGNTVILIEHHLDVIKRADWVIDMGPEAGNGGGKVVACGTPLWKRFFYAVKFLPFLSVSLHLCVRPFFSLRPRVALRLPTQAAFERSRQCPTPYASASLRAPRGTCTWAAPVPRCSTTSTPARRAARSCCASRTPTASAPPTRAPAPSSTG